MCYLLYVTIVAKKPQTVITLLFIFSIKQSCSVKYIVLDSIVTIYFVGVQTHSKSLDSFK